MLQGVIADHAGTGALDYDLYLRLLRESSYTGPLILHSLSEAEVDPAIAFLRAKLSTGNRGS